VAENPDVHTIVGDDMIVIPAARNTCAAWCFVRAVTEVNGEISELPASQAAWKPRDWDMEEVARALREHLESTSCCEGNSSGRTVR
jgi:hypothetical protein